MFLKQVIKDLFSKNAPSYWKDEGCNSRMQKYIIVSKILRVMQLSLMLIVIIFLISMATISMLKIDNANNFDDSIRNIINIYEISFVGIISINLIKNRIKKQSKDLLVFNIIKSLIVLPIIALIMFYFELVGHLMLSFWILVISVIINFLITEFNKKIKFLSEVSKGKEN